MAKKKSAKTEYAEEKGITHSTLVGWVNSADDDSEEAREISEKCRDYYDSKQLTPEEVKALKARKQAPVVVNRIKPKIDALLGMEKAAKTTVKAFPRTPKHAGAADAASEAIRFVLQDNFFEQVRSLVWEFLLIEGTGAGEVTVKETKDGFKIGITAIFWDRLIFDPHARRKDFTDARFLGQVVWTDYDDAIARYPDGKDKIEAMVSGSSTYEDKPRWADNVRRRVKLVELYYREADNWYHCTITRAGYLEGPTLSAFKNEEGESEHPYEFVSAFVDREGQRYGAVKQLLDIQDEINKRRSKALHLMSVRQIRLERGAVEDVNKVRQELSKPDGVVETTPGMEFEVLKTGDMAAAQFNLLTEAKTEIDAVGVNAALTGKDQRAISGVALQERKLAGQTELGPLFDVLRHWQYRMFRKVWNRIRQYWTDEKWIRVTDDEQNLKWVGLNRPMTKGEAAMEQAKAQGLPPEQLQQLEMQLRADPSSSEMTTHNDVAELDVDIILQEVPDTVTMQVEEFQVLGEMVKSGIPIPPDAIIEASSLSKKDKILKAMRGGSGAIPPQVQQKIQQMTEAHQMLQEQAQKLTQENQQLKTGQAEKMAKISVDKEEAQAQFNLQAWKDEQTIDLARKKAAGELQLKREVAEKDALIQADLSAKDNDRKQSQHEFDKHMKVQESGITAETDVMPVIMGKIEQSFAAMIEALGRLELIGTEQLQLQQATLVAMEKPRKVVIGSVSTDAAGRITGGVVTPTIQ